MTTKRIVFTEPRKAELLDVEVSAPKENEVTVSLEYSAISAGTERANFVGDRNGIGVAENAEAVFPRTVGYSAAGVVTAVGSEVSDLAVGDRVFVAWGKHQKQITMKRRKLVKIPDGVSTKEASMALIATFPLAAIRKTHLEIGESALVMGLGILGIFAVQQLRAAGAYPIVAVDPVAERREFALKMGADVALDPTAADFVDSVLKITDGGANICIEVTGLGIGLIQALDCMKKMGRVALLGCTRSSKFEIDYYGKVHGKGISLIGAHTMMRPRTESSAGLWTDEDDLKTLLNLTKGGRLNFADMICEIASPEDAQSVYDRLANDKKFPIGVLFDWTKREF
ncbi:MAG: zinc-binding alcohol dehydrogenase [Clostridia bacterium]|nr:zinc-binding alcohol dehydrogenase [Clostridia bacterium]